jgi:hypothetical protein
MDFTKALTYPFDDPDWISKLGILAAVFLLMFIPIIGTIPALLLITGWNYETAKNVRNGMPNPMASWSDIGGLFSRGLTLTIGLIVYQLPAIIGMCLVGGIWGLPALSGGDEDALGALMGGASLLSTCCCCLLAFYLLIAYIAYTGGYIRYMDNEELGTFFQFGDNIALVRENIGDFGMAILFMLGGGLIASLLSGTGIGGLEAGPFQSYFNSHILGQLATKLRGGGMMPQV